MDREVCGKASKDHLSRAHNYIRVSFVYFSKDALERDINFHQERYPILYSVVDTPTKKRKDKGKMVRSRKPRPKAFVIFKSHTKLNLAKKELTWEEKNHPAVKAITTFLHLRKDKAGGIFLILGGGRGRGDGYMCGLAHNTFEKKRCIILMGELVNLKQDAVFCNVYDPNFETERVKMLEHLIDTQAVLPLPWCIGGDFNSVLDLAKRRGGVCNISFIRNFGEFIRKTKVVDIPTQGTFFTWSNNREHVCVGKAGPVSNLPDCAPMIS
ncbi:hypothetical protein Ddye_024205 [Dipteronia dyeriana]|uniref:Endonuclease/exonuclease/phosphatase domain-containing protein n=1 Tax=Dipteronia dyeriana TaxID=168575 RepID=A0AAD9TUG7_9ROSI|nr:hypothetical protein Ddye_024205 [Dipteronia dyeriana]